MKHVRKFFPLATLICALTFLGAAPLHAQDKKPAPQPPESVAYLPDVTYCTIGGTELQVDIAFPKDGKGPFPAIVFVHGGGWQGGNRKIYVPVLWEAAKRGYVGVAVSYRFSQVAKFPAQIEDVKCAVRWLRANAAKYKVDVNHIGAMGDSAGGHLVGLLGVTSANDKLEGNGGNAEQSSRVQAVVPFYGVFDFTVGYEHTEKQVPAQGIYARFVMEQLLGGKLTEKPAAYKAASPVTYATKDDPPYLLIHGTADKLVLFEQSEFLQKKLKDAGVEAELLPIEGAGHGFQGKDMEKARDATFAFFDKHLKSAAKK